MSCRSIPQTTRVRYLSAFLKSIKIPIHAFPEGISARNVRLLILAFFLLAFYSFGRYAIKMTNAPMDIFPFSEEEGRKIFQA
jgi:hypothetical protein